MIDMKPVESSNIRAIGYDESKAELHVEFKGGIYIYHDVVLVPYPKFAGPVGHVGVFVSHVLHLHCW